MSTILLCVIPFHLLIDLSPSIQPYHHITVNNIQINRSNQAADTKHALDLKKVSVAYVIHTSLVDKFQFPSKVFQTIRSWFEPFISANT